MMFLCYLEQIIKDTGKKLTVEDIELSYGGDQNELMSLLKTFQSKTLRSIILHRLNKQRKVAIQLNKAAETEQWEQAETLILDGFYADLPIQKYFHFEVVRLEKQTMTVEDVEEKIRAVPRSNSFHVFSEVHVKMAGTAGHLAIDMASNLMWLHRYQ